MLQCSELINLQALNEWNVIKYNHTASVNQLFLIAFTDSNITRQMQNKQTKTLKGHILNFLKLEIVFCCFMITCKSHKPVKNMFKSYFTSKSKAINKRL